MLRDKVQAISPIRRWGRARTAVGVVAAFLGLCACEEAPPPPSVQMAQSGGFLRILHERANDLDPAFINDMYEGTVADQVFEGLVRVDANLAIVPALAESWVISEDGLRYRFQLHRGVHFHDGTPLDAEVVVASLTRLLRPDKPKECLAESYLGHIAGAREFQSGEAPSVRGLAVIDSLSLEIELEKPISFFLAVLTMDQVRIVPLTSTSGWESLGNHPVGTGPFRFATRSARGDITLVRNPKYWGRGALLDSLVFICAEGVTKEQRVSMLTAGEVDVTWIDSDHRELLEETYGFRTAFVPEMSVSFFGLNCKLPPLDDDRIRRAIAHCVGHQRFSGPKFADVIVAAGILPPGLPGYLPESRVVPYDVAAARSLVRAAGYDESNPCPPIEFYVTSSGTLLEWVEEHFRPDLAAAGIPLEVHSVGWEEIDRRVNRRLAQMFSLAWIADVPDADGFLFPLFRTDEPNNLSEYSDPEVDRSLEEARRMRSGPERLQQYRAIERRVLDQAPFIPLYHEIVLYAWNPRIEGIGFGPYGMTMVPFSRMWVREALSNRALAGDPR